MWGSHVRVHQVGPLDDQDGALALQDLAPNAGSLEDAQALSRRLGGLPLGLHHAGSYLSSPFAIERGFHSYRHSLDAGAATLLNTGTDDRSVMASTWNLSLDALADQGIPQARNLLTLLSVLAAPEPIPAQAFQTPGLIELCRPQPFEQVLSSLLAVGLISRRHLAGTWAVSVHPLVAEAQSHQMTAEQHAETLTRATEVLQAAQFDLDRLDPTDWPVWVQLVAHLIAVADNARGLAEEPLESLILTIESAVQAVVESNRHSLAEDLAMRGLAAVAHLADDHPTKLTARMSVAFALRTTGQLDESERIYRDVMTTQLRRVGESHPSILQCRHELALILLAREDLAAAKREFTAVRDARRAALGPAHLSTLGAQFSLGRALSMMDEYEAAEFEFGCAYRSGIDSLGNEHVYTLSVRQELAFAKYRLGRPEEAWDELQATLEAQLRLLGETHHDVLRTRLKLAVLRHSRGEHAEAEHEMNAVVNLMRHHFGSHHAVTIEAEALRGLLEQPES